MARRVARGSLAVLAGCVSCVSAPPAPAPVVLAVSVVAPSAPLPLPPAPAAPAAVAHSASPVASASAPGDDDEFHRRPGEIADVTAWLTARGVTHVRKVDEKLLDGSCRAARIGDPLRDALVCTEGEPSPGAITQGATLLMLDVLYPEEGRLKTALRVPMAAAGIDLVMGRPPTYEPEQFNYVNLLVEVSAGGLTLTLRDRPDDGSCAAKLLTFRTDNTTDPELKGRLYPEIRLVEAACRFRGEYAWSHGRFQRSGSLPPAPRAASRTTAPPP